ncbi:MAG TPA: ferritin-like domain-containing protein [Vicinamibacterales bacterium]|nr:ferritin-like domain-containing protein [Vicinamibacterales bacterium]
MAGSNLRESLVEEIRDLYNAEKQVVKALPKMAKGAASEELREAFESHLAETENQVTRLESIFELLDEKPRGKHCAGMAGILEEGSDTLQEDAEDAVMDAMLIAGAQKVEHYEITSYGTCIAWAEALELTEVAQLLQETLTEEKAADEKLTALAEAGINEAATAGESEDEEDMEDDEEEEEAPAASKSSSTGASARSASGSGGSGRSSGGGAAGGAKTRARGGRR